MGFPGRPTYFKRTVDAKVLRPANVTGLAPYSRRGSGRAGGRDGAEEPLASSFHFPSIADAHSIFVLFGRTITYRGVDPL